MDFPTPTTTNPFIYDPPTNQVPHFDFPVQFPTTDNNYNFDEESPRVIAQRAHFSAVLLEKKLKEHSVFELPSYAMLDDTQRMVVGIQNGVLEPMKRIYSWSLKGPKVRTYPDWLINLQSTIDHCNEMIRGWQSFLMVYSVGIATLSERQKVAKYSVPTETTKSPEKDEYAIVDYNVNSSH